MERIVLGGQKNLKNSGMSMISISVNFVLEFPFQVSDFFFEKYRTIDQKRQEVIPFEVSYTPS